MLELPVPVAPMALGPPAPEVVSTSVKLITVTEDTTLWETVAVTVTLFRAMLANAAQISASPLWTFVRSTSISGRTTGAGFVKIFYAKEVATKLDPADYERLRYPILHRDGWRCQSCGTMSNLEVHHKILRSQGGSDSEEHLITLCSACHASAHR